MAVEALTVLDLAEVAARLRKGKRWLAGWLNGNPFDAHGRPLFAQAGRTKIFTEDHVALIIQALQ